jgi:hypothetical protein
MALLGCVCPNPLGSQDCDNKTGIAQLYYTPSSNISSIVFASIACCEEGEIASFTLGAAKPDGLLQPINFVKQDDDSGAVFSWEETVVDGNTAYNYTLTFQTNSNNPSEECTIRSLLNREIAFIFKGKDGKWKFVNWSGGARVTGNIGNTNQSYKEVTLSGRANDAALFVSYTDNNLWADANLIPESLNPIGLINA